MAGKYYISTSTPDSLKVQKLMANFADRGVNTCILECSSAGLNNGHYDHIDYDIAVQTNYVGMCDKFHDSIDKYLESNLKLFTRLNDTQRQRSVINIDDLYKDQFGWASERVPSVAFSIVNYNADVYAEKIEASIFDTAVLINMPLNNKLKVITPLLGKTNVYNLLAAIASGVAAGVASALLAHIVAPVLMPLQFTF